MKRQNNAAWFMVLPVLVLVAMSSVIPTMAVVNYSFQDSFGGGEYFWVGVDWYSKTLNDPKLHAALFRQIVFSTIVLLIEIPLGIFIALNIPHRGWAATASIIICALPLMVPLNVVANIWRILARSDIGVLGATLNYWGFSFDFANNAIHAWALLIVMDVWHWTGLIAILCFAALRSIPHMYYQAAEVDGASRWATFRYIELPKMSFVLTLGFLLRLMDSLMIYTEPFVVTGGGPGTSTTFLSLFLVNQAIGQLDIGPAAAFSLIYFLIILLLSWVFYTAIQTIEKGKH